MRRLIIREGAPGGFGPLRSMPSTPMTQEEMQAQCRTVSEAAKALDYFTEDELEEFTSLHHALWSLGYDSRKERDEQRRTVFRVADGAIMGSFTAIEAWAWLRRLA